MALYVGMKGNAKPEVFESKTAPTKESHPQMTLRLVLSKQLTTQRDTFMLPPKELLVPRVRP